MPRARRTALGLVATLALALVASLVAAPSAFARPKNPDGGQAAGVVFRIDEQVITGFTKVDAGSTLRIENVPRGSQVAITDYKDATKTYPVRETSKSRLWKSDPLPPSTRLWARVTAPDGTSTKVNFATGKAANTFSMSVSPRPGQAPFGVGIPLRVTFSVPITNKEAVERALVVESTKNYGAGSWHWFGSTQAVFRPRKYWPGNAKITLNADLSTVEGAPGWFGPKVESSFRTGDAVVLKTDFNAHVMRVWINGKKVRSFPISGGKSGWETASGVKLITTHERDRRLVNPDPVEGWDVPVAYAMRITQDGEFIHDAPWNYNIGYANTSHGCTNMRSGDVAWVFRNTKYGDVVESKGSSRRVSTGEYLAGYWNYSWKDWKAGSAL